MQKSWTATLAIPGMLGHCGSQKVFLGFASASELRLHSFADVLNEDTGKGYQRRFSETHSLEFRKYIQRDGATTIPLTFNLRPGRIQRWRLLAGSDSRAVLEIDGSQGPVLAQVDCQHRLGFLKDVPVPLAFMTFIGLSPKEEMRVFNVINSKAKGLSSSLLDYHESRLTTDLSAAKPEIYIALRLHESEGSPWHRGLDLGGKKSVGMRRYASLRTMQRAVHRFLRASRILNVSEVDKAFEVVLAFWRAARTVLDKEWQDPRRHFVTKGIGVYALMSIAGDLYLDACKGGISCDETYFLGALSDFANAVDWSTHGPLRGFGGASGADQALELLRRVRAKKKLKVVGHGQ
jgi:DNA sulfur modification protein DndB